MWRSLYEKHFILKQATLIDLYYLILRITLITQPIPVPNINFSSEILQFLNIKITHSFSFTLHPNTHASRHGPGFFGALYRKSKISQKLLNQSLFYPVSPFRHRVLQVQDLQPWKGQSLSHPFLQNSLSGCMGEQRSLHMSQQDFQAFWDISV